jgi:hypothetical protein
MAPWWAVVLLAALNVTGWICLSRKMEELYRRISGRDWAN